MDGDGNVPADFVYPGGQLLQALAKGLLHERGGLVALNLMQHSNPAPPLAAYRDALDQRRAGPGLGASITVRAEGSGNYLAVQTCGPSRQPALGIDELKVK